MAVRYKGNPFFCLDDENTNLMGLSSAELEEASPLLPEVCGMETYVEGKLLGLYQTAVKEAVEQGLVPVNRRTRAVPHACSTVVTSSWLKRLECFRKDDSRGVFYLDAVLLAEIDLYGAPGQDSRKDHVRQWYRIRGQMDFEGREIHPIQKIMVYDRRDRRRERGLTQWLIPVIPRRDMDREAKRILLKCRHGYSVSGCARVDPFRLAESMHLKVIPARLSKDGHIRGELYLHKTLVRIYGANGTTKEMEVQAGTILYDTDACQSQSVIAETIVHECLHYELHWLFYSLQREYTDTIRFLYCMDARFAHFAPEDTYERWMEDESCENVMPQQAQTNRSAMEWAEWQVREMVPRVMMPAEQTRRKIEELISRHRHSPDESLTSVYSRVIPALAGFYSVTNATAKIRMLELGYMDARGVLCDQGKTSPPLFPMTGTLSPGEGYRISREDAKRLYTCDLRFRSVVDARLFRYVENCFCLNDPRFLCVTAGSVKLTPYVRAHMDQCCLRFRMGYPLHRRDRLVPHSDTPEDPIAVALSSLPLEAFQQMADQLSADCSRLPRDLGQTIVYHRKARGLTQDGLAELLDVDARTIRRIENGADDSPSQQMIAYLGLKLHLPGVYTEDLLNKAGRPLIRDIKSDKELRFVIHFMYTRPIEEVNQVLTAHGCKPLEAKKRL